MKRVVYGLGFFVLSLFFVACGGGSSSAPASSNDANSTVSDTNITAVDGYIKDAIVQDASGLRATYDANGTYRFTSSPMYPITLRGGVIEDTNVTFDINMSVSDGNSLVISPITTFLGNDSTLLDKLTNLGLGEVTLDEFSVDYVDTNDTNLAKLSQLLYVMLKDANLTATFKQDLENNSSIDTLDKLFDLAKISLNKASMDQNLRNAAKGMLAMTKDINTLVFSAKDMESYLKAYKIIAKNHYKDPGFISKLQTGQTTSFHANDDVNLSRGIARSYSRDDTKEVVVDNVTQLMWQDNADANTITKGWTDAVAYCEDLTLGGYSDWRLPSIEELRSIIDIGRYDPAINPVFQNVVSHGYWSSSTFVGGTSGAWGVGFGYGDDYWGGKSHSLYVCCVRDNN
jgi:hypothetical protein